MSAFSETTKTLHYWIRCETKEGETRVPIVPSDAKLLLAAGNTVTVESSPLRCFSDAQYQAVGCQIVQSGSWRTAPLDAIIVGLKELPAEKFPLMHTHIYFANAYKKQEGWEDLLGRFHRGGGVVLDMEYLTDETGKRVAAFGNPAGYIGLAAGLLTWCHQKDSKITMSSIPSYRDFSSLGSRVESNLRTAALTFGRRPRVVVIGAHGRVGSGAMRLAKELGLEATGWDITNTAVGGPFHELLDADIVLNGIWLNSKVEPFIDSKFIEEYGNKRNLSVLVDVSCDWKNPYHPFPIYQNSTSLSRPVLRVLEDTQGSLPLDVIAIDNLCSLIPHQCSTQFSANLVKHMLDRAHSQAVWTRCRNIYNEMIRSISSKLAFGPSDPPPVLSLPTDYPKKESTFSPLVQTLSHPLSSESVHFLRSYTKKWQSGPEILIASIYQVLLHRFTGEEEISIGYARLNEEESEYGRLRLNLGGKPSFSEFFLEAAMATRRIPPQSHKGSSVVSHLRSELDQVQSLFGTIARDSSTSSRVNQFLLSQHFDLSLFLEESNDSLGLQLLYRSGIISQERARETLSQINFLLEQISKNPDVGLEHLSLVTPHALATLPDPTVELDASWIGSIQSIFHANALKFPERTACVHRNEKVTYGQLDSMTSKLANHLIARGLKPEDPVFIYGSRNLAMVVAVIGILKSGGAVSLMDPAYPPERITNCLKVAQPRGWISIAGAGEISKEVLDFMPQVSCDILVDLPLPSQFQSSGFLSDVSDVDPEVPVTKDYTAVVTFTSGSTGLPKGVLGRHGPLTHFYPWIKSRFNLNDGDRVSMCSGISHDPLQRDIFTPLYLGAEIHIPDAEDIGNPGQLAKWMRDHKISVTHLTPAMGQLLSETEGENTKVTTLKLALFVGDKLTKRDVTRLRGVAPQVCAVNMYGSTETQRSVTYYVVPPNDVLEGMKEILPVGVGMKDVQCLVLNDGRRVGVGEVGEIWMRSSHLAAGYRGLADVTAQKFVKNPFRNDAEDRFYRTGDFGRYYTDGQADVVGRLDNQVKIRGFRIELGEINTALSAHAGVKENIPTVREDVPGDKKIVAYVIPRNISEPPHASELRAFLASKLPHYMVPSAFVFLSSIPLTPNGKIAFDQLPPPSSEPDVVVFPEKISAAKTRSNFHNADEVAVATVWQEVLGVTSFGPNDDFFSLGGHSLLATRCVAKLNRVFDAKLPLNLLLQNPTVPALAKAARDFVNGLGVAQEFEPDVDLDDSIFPPANSTVTPITAGSKFFLTGGTGFLGSFILYDLLQRNSTSQVYVLVRTSDKIDGKQRIKHALKLHRLWEDTFEDRIIPVPGELGRPLLGLTQEDFDSVSSQVDSIIHCAAYVHWLLPYEQMKAANVLGTQEAIRMAVSGGKLKTLHHVSTTAVLESDYFAARHTEPVDENLDLRPYFKGLRGGYAQSKWAAEKLVMEARDRGIPTNIYRPAYISGDIKNGVWTTDDFLCRVIKGCLQMQTYPRLSNSLDVSPVDFVAGAIVEVAQRSDLINRNFHLTNGVTTSFNDFFSFAKNFGYQVNEVSFKEWRLRLLELQEKGSDNALQAVSSIFAEDYENQLPNPPLSRVQTEQVLGQVGVTNTKIQDQLPLYFSYFVRSSFLPHPEDKSSDLYQTMVEQKDRMDLVTRTNRSSSVNKR